MKGIRGRYGQHQLLNSEIGLSKYLLKTSLLSSSTFYDFLRNYNFIIIKPLIGPQEVRIFVRDDSIELVTGNMMIYRFQNEDETYEYLTRHICSGKYYVIQAMLSNPNTLSHFYFTLHKESDHANWKVVKITPITENSVKSRVKDLVTLWKLKQKTLLLAAKELGTAFPKCRTVVIEVAKSLDGRAWLVDTVLHDRNSKWSQYHSLQRKRALRQFLPDTDLCTKKTLLAFLKEYTEVIIKPCVGQQGRGIVKISKSCDTKFEVHEKRGITIKEDFDALYGYIVEQYLSQKDYLVQQRIPLAEINGCPFDVRVILQFDEGRWIVTGMLVKLAVKGSFVTNRASKLLTLEEALSSLENRMSSDNYAEELETITQKASSRLFENTGELTIIGYDIGIDDKGAVWVIEGNYAPSLSMFYMFNNNEMYNRIYYYIKRNKQNDIF